jgi:hypothetical protein
VIRVAECRYVLVRLVADPLREEPLNIGIIAQTDERIDSKFTKKLPRSVYAESDLVADVFNGLEDEWRRRLAAGVEKMTVPGEGVVDVPVTDPRYLEWLRSTHIRHIQLSEMRNAEVEIKSQFDFDGVLLHLFDTFVRFRPQAKRVVARLGTRLHTRLRRDFKPLIEDNKMLEAGLVEGTILWRVDFTYRNAKQVAILTADFGLKSIMEHTEHIFAAWADLRDTKGDDIERCTVFGNYRATAELKKAALLLERVSSQVYEYEGQRESLVQMVYRELKEEPPLLSTGHSPDIPKLAPGS